jgi:hypothetical protein
MDDPSDTFDQQIAIKNSIQTPKNTTQPIPLTPYNPNKPHQRPTIPKNPWLSSKIIKTYFSKSPLMRKNPWCLNQKSSFFYVFLRKKHEKTHGFSPPPLDLPWLHRASGTFTVSSVGGTALATAPCSQQVAPSGSTISTSQRP